MPPLSVFHSRCLSPFYHSLLKIARQTKTRNIVPCSPFVRFFFSFLFIVLPYFLPAGSSSPVYSGCVFMRLVPASGLCVLLLQLALRFFGQQVRHTLQADADGGEVVQHSRRGRLQDAQSTQRDKGRVEGEHEAVVCVHALLPVSYTHLTLPTILLV